MRAGVEAFGDPVYGLAGVGGTVSQYGDRLLGVLYQLGPADRLEVTNGRYPLGGTRGLMVQLTAIVIPAKPHLPWELSFRQRNAFVTFDGTRTQFHVVQASTGDWIAAGGFDKWGVRKRYLRLTGTPGVNVEDLSLAPVGFDLGEE